MKNESKSIIGILIIISELFLYKYYIFCLNCYKNVINKSKCFKCPTNIIFKGLKILSDEITLNEIIYKKKSIARYGGGEFQIIFGINIGFQKPNFQLAKRLIEVLNSNEKNMLIGLNIPYKKEELGKLTYIVRKYWYKYFNKYKIKLAKLINKKKKYYSANISRFYMRYQDKNNVAKFVNKLKQIWNKKNILIIEGEKSKLGVGNDLFDNAQSIKRIICPIKNAFNVYDKIIKEVLKIKEKRLILIALGPTATILSYDLHKLGYQSVDIGHADIEYEWYLRKSKTMIHIGDKFVNEAKGPMTKNIIINDKRYFRQIVAKIIN